MKLLLRNHQSPGDVLMLTAAVRDLHHAHPGRYTTAVQTPFGELWENNPLVVSPEELGEPDEVIDCGYPLVHHSNRRPFHFIHGFVQDLESRLGVRIPVGAFKGDLYLSARERQLPSPAELAGHAGPYWVIVAGGKLDFTAKWWDPEGYQAVVDHFAGRLTFVQCGAAEDWHVPLRGVVNLVGKTTLRELIRLIHHTDGVLCPITLAMHLAAAVPARPGAPMLRPCVVLAGGREPPHWEMYPGHQFLHTVGALNCCATGGCWKSRCTPVGDGHPSDADLCERPVSVGVGVRIGRCMEMITPRKVCEAVESYYQGGILQYPGDAAAKRPVIPPFPRARTGATGVAVTIGVGDYAELAGLAAREIASLTGLKTQVLGDAEFAASGLEHPDFLKFRLFELVDAENILFFDADIVCLERWDPSQHFGKESITCVRDRLMPIRDEAGRWGVPPEEYFNAGFFIASRRHHHDWLRRAESQRLRWPTPWFAQSPLNAARYELGIGLNLLDRRYNWVEFGGSTLSHDVPVVMAHKLAPRRYDLNVAYFRGRYALFEPRLLLNRHAARRLAGKDFVLEEDGKPPRPLHLRSDGTVLPIATPDCPEDYWFVHDVKERPTLALSSELEIVREFVEVFGGHWVDAASLGRGGKGVRLIEHSPQAPAPITVSSARRRADEFLRTVGPYPASRFAGRGIVICGGGETYFPCAWVAIRMLRHVGCELPIELWQTTFSEISDHSRALLEPYGVRCVDAGEVRLRYPARNLCGGWELKPYALGNCAFEEVLLLDADNVAVRDPAFLFEAPQYRQTGAVFWPDTGRLRPDHPIWQICDVPYRDEPEFESGQILLDKRRCWRALQLTLHLNDNSDFYYEHLYGDKDTFHLAWRMLGQEYAMVPHPVRKLERTFCQHDFEGKRLFQHRYRAKWSLRGRNPRIEGFELENVCLAMLDELRAAQAAPGVPQAGPALKASGLDPTSPTPSGRVSHTVG